MSENFSQSPILLEIDENWYTKYQGHKKRCHNFSSLRVGPGLSTPPVFRIVSYHTEASGQTLLRRSVRTKITTKLITFSSIFQRPLQVLAGHEKPVRAVALSVSLDLAVSGSEDGTVNVYTIKEGQFLRSLKPPGVAETDFVVGKLALSSQGHIVIGGHSKVS